MVWYFDFVGFILTCLFIIILGGLRACVVELIVGCCCIGVAVFCCFGVAVTLFVCLYFCGLPWGSYVLWFVAGCFVFTWFDSLVVYLNLL